MVRKPNDLTLAQAALYRVVGRLARIVIEDLEHLCQGSALSLCFGLAGQLLGHAVQGLHPALRSGRDDAIANGRERDPKLLLLCKQGLLSTCALEDLRFKRSSPLLHAHLKLITRL